MSITIVLFGIVAFNLLGVREYPSVDPPVITVSTIYTGANSSVIEAQITEPLESSINGIAGIKSMTSVSADGRSAITIEFELGVNMEDAANDVRDRVSRAMRNLPPDVNPPIVSKADANSSAMIVLTLQSDIRNLLELSDAGNNLLKEALQTISGVSEVRIFGEKKYAMRLLLNPEKLAAHRLTPADVRNALNRENIELPTGRIEGYYTEMSIRTMSRLESENDFNNLIIKQQGSNQIRLIDVGRAVLSPENERTLMRGAGGIPMIGIAIFPQPGANFIAIADEVYKRIEVLKKELPPDLRIGYALDTTRSIRRGIFEVQETILIAFLLVVFVIFVFLRSWRTTIIPIIAIPISLIGSFFVMYFMGYSINILSLLGIVLATGLVVDDAIVVLENIYSKIENGMEPLRAGNEGVKEIFFAVIATTVTLVAVILPIVFLQGITGRLFREFGIVLVGAVIISSFVSLTLTPMMSTRILGKKRAESRFSLMVGGFFYSLSNFYALNLSYFLKRRWIALVIIALSIAAIFLIGRSIPSELAPLEDRSRLFVQAVSPEGTSFEMMDRYIADIVDLVDTLPERSAIVAVTSFGVGGAAGSVNSGFVRLVLTDPSTRKRTQQDIANYITSHLRGKTFARAFVTQEQTIATDRSGGLPVQFVVQAQNFQKLKEAVPAFLERTQSDPRFQIVDLNLKFNKPEIKIDIDRNKAQASGVSVLDIAEILQLYFSGQRYGYFIKDGKQYQIIGEAERIFRDDPSDLTGIMVRNNRGNFIELGSLVNISEESTPPQRYRYNRYVSATFSASTVPGVTLGEGIAAMREIAAEKLDESFSTSLTGSSQQFEDSSSSLIFAFIFALVLVYLVLAAQFESYRDPLIIMFTVPLSLAGALLSLYIFGQTMNIFSQIGIIVLIGIVTKNGILIVEFANQKKARGLDTITAVTEAAGQRLRPILMTSLATIFGAAPIAFSIGAASTSRVPMGITIIGGLLFSLILTLFVIPAMYVYLSIPERNQ